MAGPVRSALAAAVAFVSLSGCIVAPRPNPGDSTLATDSAAIGDGPAAHPPAPGKTASNAGGAPAGGAGKPYLFTSILNGQFNEYGIDPGTGELSPEPSRAFGTDNVVATTGSSSARRIYAVSGGRLSGFAVGSSGDLTPIDGTVDGVGPSVGVIHPSGRWMWMIDGEGTVTTVALAVNGTPTVTGRTDTGTKPLGVGSCVVDASGTRLVVVQTNKAAPPPTVANVFATVVSVFAIDPATGALSARHDLTVGGEARAAVHPSLEVVYLVGANDQQVNAYAIGASGELTLINSETTGQTGFPWPFTGIVHPSGRFLYVSNEGENLLDRLELDPTTGALGAITHAPGPPQGFDLVLDPSGKWLYVDSGDEGQIYGYGIDERGTATPIKDLAPLAHGYTLHDALVWTN